MYKESILGPWSNGDPMVSEWMSRNMGLRKGSGDVTEDEPVKGQTVSRQIRQGVIQTLQVRGVKDVI